MSRNGRGTLDHITAALARLREAVTPAGFEVGEVTLSFDDDTGEVGLKVRLGIDAGLLTPESATPEGPSAVPGGESIVDDLLADRGMV